jgi:tripartite-type tricarboxylate transporter receptor subunit TctC
MIRLPSGALPCLLMVALLTAATDAVFAQGDYPTRPIKIIVSAPAGTVLDSLPRIVADKLAARWGQPVIIENRPGAAQNIGAEAVAKAEPDGYMLLATPEGPLVISQHVFSKLGFDPSAFVPVSILVTQPIVLLAHPDAPYSSRGKWTFSQRRIPGRSATVLQEPAVRFT